MNLKPLVVMSLSLMAAVPAFAVEQAMMEMDLEQLLQVSITGATLREESLKSVPSSTTVYTRDQLDSLGLDYLHELLSLVPGLQVSRSADSGINYTYSFRGRRQGGRAVEVLLMVDGRELSDPRSPGADSALFLFPLANIERVEIIRGPSSAIYGSGAFTGVINIISRKGQNRMKLGAGELGKRVSDVNLSHASGDWDTNLFAHLAADDGQAYTVNGAATRDPRTETVIDWNLGYQKTRFRAFISRVEADDFLSLERVNNDINYYRQESRHLRLEHELTPSDNWKTSLSLNYQDSRQALHGEVQPQGALRNVSDPSSDAPFLAKGDLRGEAYRAQIANDLTLNDDVSVQFGGEWAKVQETKADTRTNYDFQQFVTRDFPISYYGNFSHEFPIGLEDSRVIGGLYGQLLYAMTADTRLIGGLRYDHYESVDNNLSPRLGIVHNLNANQTIKLHYGEAFRAPSFGETSVLNNPVLVGNPGLDNESVGTLELMWMGTWNRLSLGATAYQNRYQNPIQTGVINNVRTYINGADQKNWGAGVRMDWQINDQWMLRTHYSTLRDLPDAYFREADEIAAVMLSYLRGSWNWSFSALYNGPREYLLTATQRASLDSYWIAHSQLRYQLNRSSSVSLAAKNLFDERFSTPAQGAGLVGGVPNRGREVTIYWQWEW